MITATIRGAEHIKEVGLSAQRAVKRKGLLIMATALTPVATTAKSLAPADTGSLRRAIGVKIKRFRAGGKLFAVVGVRAGKFGTDDVPRKYSHLAEHGFIHSSGKHVPGKPFMRPAWLRHKQQIVDSIGGQVGDIIINEVRRKRRRRRHV